VHAGVTLKKKRHTMCMKGEDVEEKGVNERCAAGGGFPAKNIDEPPKLIKIL